MHGVDLAVVKEEADREGGHEGRIIPQDYLRRERRHRPLAFWMSFLFLLAAVGLIGFFLWSSGLIVPKRHKLPKIEVMVTDDGTIVVRNTRISGLDDEGLPFTIIAQMSERREADKNRIHLRNVKGTLTKRNGEIIRFSSDRGEYDTESETATLIDNVHVSSQGRYDLYAKRARVHIPDKVFTVPGAVRVILKDGEIRAGNMRTARNSDHVFFGGRVYATFRNGTPAKETQKDSGGRPEKQNRANARE